jgi:septal ring factor EnvC (AmiA/AmiB activator)
VRRYLCLLLLSAGLAAPVVAFAQGDPGPLREKLDRTRDRERSLAGDVARLGRLASRLERQLAVLERRRAEVAADLARDRARLAVVQAKLRAERARLTRLRRRLAEVRRTLAERLVADYKTSEADVWNVVVSSADLGDLLERVEFVRAMKRRDRDVLRVVRSARADATRETKRLAAAEDRRREVVAGLTARRNALAGMGAAVRSRRTTLVRVRAARAASLRATRADRRRVASRLRSAEAAVARAAAAAPSGAGVPSGGWAIPAAIVMCESGGQNMPPNSAGASGYYQIVPGTWRQYGGRGPAAWKASKAEQDRVAAAIWAGGRGASQWVCSALV